MLLDQFGKSQSLVKFAQPGLGRRQTRRANLGNLEGGAEEELKRLFWASCSVFQIPTDLKTDSGEMRLRAQCLALEGSRRHCLCGAVVCPIGWFGQRS